MTLALSSGDADLYALGSGTAETMGVRLLFGECDAMTDGYVTMATDSAAGKSMASRLAGGRLRSNGLRKVGAQDNLADLH